jgi:hypothetical protein
LDDAEGRPGLAQRTVVRDGGFWSEQLELDLDVAGLMLVALAREALGTHQSARAMMKELADIKATLARTQTGDQGRRPTVMIPPELSSAQRQAVKTFELARWMPTLSSTM